LQQAADLIAHSTSLQDPHDPTTHRSRPITGAGVPPPAHQTLDDRVDHTLVQWIRVRASDVMGFERTLMPDQGCAHIDAGERWLYCYPDEAFAEY
jgi:hypothetical protein